MERGFRWQDDPQDRAPMTEAIDTIEELRARVAELKNENSRLITLAADAIGTDPEYRSAGCVEALVQHYTTVKEDNERLSAALAAKQQEVNNAMEMFFKQQAENDRLQNELIFVHRRLSAQDDSYNKVSVVIGSIELRFPDIAKAALAAGGE